MKKSTLIIASFLCFALASATANAALSYWDSNGATPGAGATPDGTWDPADPGPYFWTSDPTGSSPTNAWVGGDTAVFCANTDAVNAFTATINGSVDVGGITFSNGMPTVTGGTINMTNEFLFPVDCRTDATINSSLSSASDTTGILKTGPAKLTTSGGSWNGTNIIKEGTYSITTISGMGNTLPPTTVPTIVSNGASLDIAAALSFSAAKYLEIAGTGVSNQGAFFASVPQLSGNNGWKANVILTADAKISYLASAQWTFTGGYIGTNGVTVNNVTFGGDGGTLRLNNTGVAPGQVNARTCFLGSGSIIKEGTMTLRLETAGVLGSFYFNEGKIACRYPMFGSTLYVGAAAQEINNPNASPGISQPIVLASGANLLFNLSGGASSTITCSGVISGQGGLSATNLGKLSLTKANTYSGNTTVCGNAAPAAGAGTIVLGATGSIASSPVIDVQQNALFDVSAVTGGFVLQSAQTLKGNGAITGSVTANGTLSPGASIGTLTFNNDLILGASAKLAIEVDRSGPTCDTLAVTGMLTNVGGGSLVVANTGAALQAGDSFTVCSQPLLNGQALAVAGGGVVWTNELATSGKITVLPAAPVAATGLAATVTGPTSVKVTGAGVPNTAYAVYASTNVTTPMANWSVIGTAVANGSGVIQFTDTQATGSQKFYRFGQ